MAFEYDPNRYRGMSQEEARAAEAEDRRRADAEDPRVIASIAAFERERERVAFRA
jgi:hypothetical protein